jgi:hypothetical protein
LFFANLVKKTKQQFFNIVRIAKNIPNTASKGIFRLFFNQVGLQWLPSIVFCPNTTLQGFVWLFSNQIGSAMGSLHLFSDQCRATMGSLQLFSTQTQPRRLQNVLFLSDEGGAGGISQQWHGQHLHSYNHHLPSALADGKIE